MKHFINTRWKVHYTNYRGINAVRNILIKDLYIGSNKYYPEQQLLLTVYDYDKKAERIYAANNINKWIQQLYGNKNL